MTVFIKGGLKEPVNRMRLLIIGIVLGSILYGGGVYIAEVLALDAIAERKSAGQAGNIYSKILKPGMTVHDPNREKYVKRKQREKVSKESLKIRRQLHLKEISIGVFVILSMPYFWYGFLNRVRELSAATKK